MTQKIQVDLDVNEAKAVSAWLRYRKSIEAVNQEMGKTGRVSQKNKREAQDYLATVKKMGSEALTSFTGIGSAISGIAVAATLINQQHEALLQRQKNQFVTGRDFGQVMRDVRVAFNEDDTLKNPDLEKRILEVSKKTRTNENIVGTALVDTFSAKGPRSNQDAMNAVEAAFSLIPNNLEAGKTLAARALDVSNAFPGSDNMKANVGFMQNVQESARITSLEQVGANLLPGIISVSQQGDTAEQAAEIAVTMTKLMTDAEGRLTRTAITNMSARMAEYVPSTKGKDNRGKFKVPQEQIDAYENAKNTTERIAVMQQSPELARQFFSQYSFDAASAASVKALLTGTDVAKAQYEASQKQIRPLDENQVKTFDDKVQKIEGGTFQPLVRAEEQSKINISSARLSDREGQLLGAARQIMEQTMTDIGAGPMDLKLSDFKSGTVDRVSGKNDIETYIEELENRQYFENLNGRNTNSDIIQSQIENLKSLNSELKALQPKPGPGVLDETRAEANRLRAKFREQNQYDRSNPGENSIPHAIRSFFRYWTGKDDPQPVSRKPAKKSVEEPVPSTYGPVVDVFPAQPDSTIELTKALKENTAALREQKDKTSAPSGPQKPVQVSVSVTADASTAPNGPRASASLARPLK
ncbi:hypothetical protein [Gimesia chilikensis]|uniref:hypothetical protein n=1 Tax=Gimesia chilikensis TaxID=2605989 RepID=UPI001188A8E8|nr:hypothetical protein [Gimesia chilikensis]QDT84575.1 hypothetical protein MalM14_22350 [Gimesia chilikensis]